MNVLHKASLAFSLAVAAYALYVAWVLYSQYRKTDPTLSRMQRAIAAAKNSQTILWNQVVIVVAGITSQLDNVADFFNMPELKDFINNTIGNPQVVSGIMLAIAVVSIRARLRPGSNDPVK